MIRRFSLNSIHMPLSRARCFRQRRLTTAFVVGLLAFTALSTTARAEMDESITLPVAFSEPAWWVLSVERTEGRVEPWRSFEVNLDRLFGPFEKWHQFNLRVESKAAIALPHPWLETPTRYSDVLSS